MIEMIRTLANAQSAVTLKLVHHWRAFLRASLVPAAAAVCVFVWMSEAYGAAANFAQGQAAVLFCAGALALFLSSLAVGRMVRLALGLDADPARIRALGADARDGRLMLLAAGFIILAGAALLLEAGAARIVLAAFVAPGSDVIARPVLALCDAAILIGTYYLMGRLSMFYPASVAEPDRHALALWRATEGHGALLFVVTLAVPAAALAILAGPALVWAGILPWPGLGDFAGIAFMAQAVIARSYVVVPALFAGLLAAWSLMAAGLAAAWDALQEREALDRMRT